MQSLVMEMISEGLMKYDLVDDIGVQQVLSCLFCVFRFVTTEVSFLRTQVFRAEVKAVDLILRTEVKALVPKEILK